MPAPTNTFKQRLKAGETQIGFWLGMGSANAAEIAGGHAEQRAGDAREQDREHGDGQ